MGIKMEELNKEHAFKKFLVKELSFGNELQLGEWDSLKWSWRSRYAIAAFGGKETEDSTTEKSIMWVWDNRKKKIIRRYGFANSRHSLDNYIFALECHPKLENFFISGGGGGKVVIWDISKEDHEKQDVQTFTESGAYHRDPGTLNEIFDGKFSSWGKFIAISTVWGTISIYSIYDKEPYFATPIEQFFQFDKMPQAHSNIYNEVDAFLWNFDYMKHTEQPPLPILGERYLDRKMPAIQYNIQYKERYSKFMMEQKFTENYAEDHIPYAIISKHSK